MSGRLSADRVSANRVRVGIVPSRLCECSEDCTEIVCSDIWNDGSITLNFDTKIFLDYNCNIIIYLGENLRRIFIDHEDEYNNFVDNMSALAAEIYQG